ncbi:hypothetical protein SERLADRAFT_346612 [Serpula lacrymans var. lacrymans S7.9]|uniref:Uncharacterized protein n=1 Tax=Serpula lacrymans var. lacrymans (strain S7.9) TaxID=578457 RepID=F8NK17_SERL9|nr:uncharacterized protein SERLADRAFT_346612 [Serpula lacrymans var. lacrymans S7.9]EGO28329.1 hypothetical protein SERLADRAFT_346612 [Serpula lacrymans var. lacrymans S7.9]
MHTYLFQKKICLNVCVEDLARGTVHPRSALLDSSTNSIFIDQVLAEQNGLPLVKLDVSIPIYNIDGTLNAGGCITHRYYLWSSAKDTENESSQKLPN